MWNSNFSRTQNKQNDTKQPNHCKFKGQQNMQNSKERTIFLMAFCKMHTYIIPCNLDIQGKMNYINPFEFETTIVLCASDKEFTVQCAHKHLHIHTLYKKEIRLQHRSKFKTTRFMYLSLSCCLIHFIMFGIDVSDR